MCDLSYWDGTKQRNIASLFIVSVSNRYFLLQRLIRLLTLWQEFNKIGHREHSEVKKRVLSL